MMTFYGLRQGQLVRLDHSSTPGLPAPADVLWIDLLDPSRDNERAVETLLGLAVPTRQEMAEIVRAGTWAEWIDRSDAEPASFSVWTPEDITPPDLRPTNPGGKPSAPHR